LPRLCHHQYEAETPRRSYTQATPKSNIRELETFFGNIYIYIYIHSLDVPVLENAQVPRDTNLNDKSLEYQPSKVETFGSNRKKLEKIQ